MKKAILVALSLVSLSSMASPTSITLLSGNSVGSSAGLGSAKASGSSLSFPSSLFSIPGSSSSIPLGSSSASDFLSAGTISTSSTPSASATNTSIDGIFGSSGSVTGSILNPFAAIGSYVAGLFSPQDKEELLEAIDVKNESKN